MTNESKSKLNRRLKPYPGYKDSGVEWLGRIPDHWTCAPVYSRYQVQLGKMLDGSKITGEHLAPYLRNVDVQWGRVNTKDLPQMDFSRSDRIRFKLQPGDLLVCEGGEVGRSAIWRESGECYYQKAIHRLRPLSPSDEPRFMFYTLFVAAKRGVFLAGGNSNTIDHLPAEKLRKYRFAFPPSREQKNIADFLNRQTGRIDALINKKARLIELLQQKRTELITRAVTEGLNSNTPKKDFGMPWLSNVPNHWQCLQLRRFVVSMCDGPFGSDMKSSHYSDTGVRLIRLQNIGQGRFDDTDRAFIPESHFKSLQGHDALPGDLLVAGLGDPNNPVGRACLLPSTVPIAMVKADCFRVRLKEDRLMHSFVSYFMCSSAGRAAAQDQSRGATRERINLNGLSRILVTVPPVIEQQTIVDYIGNQTAKLDVLLTKVRMALDRLQEYRTALICAAVTGQIDVCEANADEVKIVKLPPAAFRRAVFAAEVIHQLHDDATFGHVKCQKILHLAEYHLGLQDFESNYFRQAAGPYDNQMIRSVDGQLERLKWYGTKRVDQGVHYVALEKAGSHVEYFGKYWERHRTGLANLITLLRALKTEHCEVVSTLYAIWNDRLLAGKSCDDESMINEARHDWHASKLRIPVEHWQKTLEWMRKKGLVPKGSGKPIKSTHGK